MSVQNVVTKHVGSFRKTPQDLRCLNGNTHGAIPSRHSNVRLLLLDLVYRIPYFYKGSKKEIQPVLAKCKNLHRSHPVQDFPNLSLGESLPHQAYVVSPLAVHCFCLHHTGHNLLPIRGDVHVPACSDYSSGSSPDYRYNL